jgi:hypothetical protein
MIIPLSLFQGYGAMSPGGGVQQDPTSSVPASLLSSSATGLPPMSTFRGSGGGVAGPGPGGQVTPTGATGVVGVPTSSPAQALFCGSHSPAVGVPQPQTSGDTLGKALASVSCFQFLFQRLTARFVVVPY